MTLITGSVLRQRISPIFVMEEKLTIMRRFLSSLTLNTSSTTEIDTTRYLNEYLLIRRRFFEI